MTVKVPLPAWLTFNRTTLTFSGTPAASDAGTDVIEVTATDQFGAAAAADFNMIVKQNTAPTVANQIPAQSGTVSAAFSYTMPSNTFTTADGTAMSYGASGLPAGV